jgi:glutamine cyclotransferase
MNINFKGLLFIAVTLVVTAGCNNNSSSPAESLTISPDAGTNFKLGDQVKVNVNIPASLKADSVAYFVDAVRMYEAKDTTPFVLKTDSMTLGSKLITAKVYTAGKAQEVSTNVTLLAAKAPEQYTFKVEKVLPHDTSSYTEGLVYENGYLYESGGGYKDSDGQSSLSKYDPMTGKIIKKVMVDPKVFAEGISIIGDKIVQLTYHEKIGYVYDKNTFKLLSTFNNNVGAEGWGMCFDGSKLYMDDSTNRLWLLNKDNYRQMGYIDVYDNNHAINSINELEYIDGKLYANVYETNNILVIDPKNGSVLQNIDLSTLYPESQRNKNANVLNGIAYDKQNNRIFITGKKWDKLFVVKFVKR